MIGPVLVTGANGMLARAWRELLRARQVDHLLLTYGDLDITRDAQVNKAIDGSHRIVINCAAYTDVDGAESEPELANQVNGDGAGLLAQRCRLIGAKLVHFSTDYVFDGQAATEYPTTAPRNPINCYGQSKAAGEQAIESSGCPFLLVRSSWLYAPWGKNFVRTIARLASQRDTLRVVNDQRGRPTSCEHLADATWRLLQDEADGIWHVTDGGDCTWFQFAVAIGELLNLDCDIAPCTTKQYPLPAARPANSVLDTRQTESRLGPMPHWRDNLADVVARLEPLT